MKKQTPFTQKQTCLPPISVRTARNETDCGPTNFVWKKTSFVCWKRSFVFDKRNFVFEKAKSVYEKTNPVCRKANSVCFKATLLCPKRDLLSGKAAGEAPAEIVFLSAAVYLARTKPFLARRNCAFFQWVTFGPTTFSGTELVFLDDMHVVFKDDMQTA